MSEIEKTDGSSRPRITISLDEESVLEVWLNEAGRDLLVRELQGLSRRSDHFHLRPEPFDGEVPVRTMAYRDGDRIVEWGKVMLRPDDWDEEHFPHVLGHQADP